MFIASMCFVPLAVAINSSVTSEISASGGWEYYTTVEVLVRTAHVKNHGKYVVERDEDGNYRITIHGTVYPLTPDNRYGCNYKTVGANYWVSL